MAHAVETHLSSLCSDGLDLRRPQGVLLFLLDDVIEECERNVCYDEVENVENKGLEIEYLIDKVLAFTELEVDRVDLKCFEDNVSQQDTKEEEDIVEEDKQVIEEEGMKLFVLEI